jgi:Flp pilus assembly protein TadD
LNFAAVRWAVTSMEAANWHPLTWLSHLIDVELFGLTPAGPHAVNLLFHIANSVLLLLLFERMTGSMAKSGLVAALFAVHPQHVESVAWIAERKDVLSAFFWLLTVTTYLRYVRAGQKQIGRRREYVILCVLFFLGLMAKPMVLTLPFVLLLLDYWPLNRISFGQQHMTASKQKQSSTFRALLLEKVPLFVLSSLSIAITYVAQWKGGAVSSLEGLPSTMRIANAVVAYAKYLGKTIWPTDLVVLYPLPVDFPPVWQIAGACVLLIVITVAVVAKAVKLPFLPVGWFWFLGMLVPVIGLLQVGVHHIADRYTYLPSIGLFVAGAWAIPAATRRWRGGPAIRSGVALAILVCLMWVSREQVGYWKDSVTLFSHAITVNENNILAHDHLGAALEAKGDYQEAIAHYLRAISINTDIADALKPRLVQDYDLQGNRMLQEGRFAEAAANFQHALSLSRTIPLVHNKLGVALARQGKEQQAIESFLQAIELNPAYSEAHFNLAVALERQGRLREAITHYEQASRLSPNDSEVAGFLRSALGKEQRP